MLMNISERLLRTNPAPAASVTDEPFAWVEHHKGGDNLVWDEPGGRKSPLYTRHAPGVPDALKDHQIAAMVNSLRDIARQFHGHDSLRERIANVLVPALKAEAKTDVRCEGCGYMTHHREHMGCVRAAKQFIHPSPGVPDDVVRDAIATVREQYRGTDWGKAAEGICDAIDSAIAAALGVEG